MESSMNEKTFQTFLNDIRTEVLQDWCVENEYPIPKHITLMNLRTFCRNKGLSEIEERVLFTEELNDFTEFGFHALSLQRHIDKDPSYLQNGKEFRSVN